MMVVGLCAIASFQRTSALAGYGDTQFKSSDGSLTALDSRNLYRNSSGSALGRIKKTANVTKS